MKKIVAIVIAGLFVVSGGLVLAADVKSPAPAPGVKMEQIKGDWQAKRLEKMSTDLSLTPPQKEQIAGFWQSDEPKIRVIMDRMMADLKVINEATEQKIRAVLTPEQIKKYDQIKADRQKKMEEQRDQMNK